MKRQYDAPSLELLYLLMEENILSDQITPGTEDDYGEF